LKQVQGVALRRDPARESCFTVVQLPHDLCEYSPGSALWERESLHRHLNTELQSLEIAAQSLVDFPDAPWELRVQHARQCWDESRHAGLIARQLTAHGGFKGEFPIINYDWGLACALDSLPARLAVQNRTVEAGEMDLLRQLRDLWRDAGDAGTAAVMDGILADEIQHVRFANRWLQQEARDNPRVLMQVARAIQYVQTVTDAFTPDPGARNRAGIEMAALDRTSIAINYDDRRLAGFSDADLAALAEQASAPSNRGAQ
jgi:uncharacterized ferritin-like protein (DUF455 family)